MNPMRDQIAREAARLIELGRESAIPAAIKRAMDAAGTLDSNDAPSHGHVRRHIQGFAMQTMGEHGYADEVARTLAIAEEVMTVFEDARPILAGRASKGQIAGGVTLHIRIYTNRPVGQIAQTLVDFGYEEPRIETINTRWGRINRLRFTEDGCEVVLSRCLPEMWKDRARGLTRDEAVSIIDLSALRGRLA